MGANNTVWFCGSLHETSYALASIGTALGAAKKINLGGRIFGIVHVRSTAWTSTQRSSADDRSDGVCAAHRHSVARSPEPLRPVEFGLHALATLVSVRFVGADAGAAGASGHRHPALLGCQPY